MCRKLLFLITVLGLVGTAWADDINPPPWRGTPGSTVSQWTYDNPPPVIWDMYPRLDAPDYGWFVPHPEKGDPGNFLERAIDEGWITGWWEMSTWHEGYGDAAYYEDNFSMQLFGQYQWLPTFFGRTGVLYFDMGSWDIYNFWSMQPAKDMWVQLTWQPWNRGSVIEFYYEMEYSTLGPLTWTPLTWTQPGWSQPWWWCGSECGWEGGWEGGFWEGGWTNNEVWNMIEGDLIAFETIALEGDWRVDKFLIELSPNPVKESFGLFPSGPIAIDQIVFDTICIPEPVTIALLGLGGLALLRRKKR